MDDWTPWLDLEGAPPLSAGVLAEVLDGGQCFRWNPSPEESGAWRGTWGRCHAELRCSEEGLQWRAPLPLAARVEAELPRYFPEHDEMHRSLESLPWRGDAVLSRALRRFPGLCLLRQPIGETLLGFLCSTTKRIPQIKAMLAALAARLGDALAPGVHALPSWDRLAATREAELRACGLGFRAGFVHRTARALAGDPSLLDRALSLPYAEARALLRSLPGVGPKVADCVLLFGAGRMEAFPVDTWILRVMRLSYGLDGWSPAQVEHFGRVHFGPYAGLAQQFLFSWARHETRLGGGLAKEGTAASLRR